MLCADHCDGFATERYKGDDAVRDELLALRRWLGAEELRALDATIAELAGRTSADERRLAEQVAELERAAGALEPLEAAAGGVGRELDRATAAAATLETQAERLRGLASVAAERRRSLAARFEGADERRADLDKLLEWLEASAPSPARTALEGGHLFAHERLVVSPGVPLSIPALARVRAQQVPVLGEVEVAWRELSAPLIGITGTNGKTTVSTMVGAILEKSAKTGFGSSDESQRSSVVAKIIRRVTDEVAIPIEITAGIVCSRFNPELRTKPVI